MSESNKRLSRKRQLAQRGHRLPAIVPMWLRRRVEMDNTALLDFVGRVAATVPAGSLVLDAGAGEGRYQPEFAHTRFIGVDLAVGDAEWDYHNLDAICTLVELPFQANAFDAVLLTQVLEHVPEPLAVLKEIQRVLKPGGRLFLTVPQSWHQHQKPHDYFRYTSFGLKYLFERAGLQPQSIEPMGGYFWVLAFQLHMLNYWLFPHGMRWRKLTWPIRALFGLVFQLFFPFILYYLDRFDRQKDETFGHACVAVKPDAQSS
jgi:SAM-dependent methyltransferase